MKKDKAKKEEKKEELEETRLIQPSDLGKSKQDNRDISGKTIAQIEAETSDKKSVDGVRREKKEDVSISSDQKDLNKDVDKDKSLDSVKQEPLKSSEEPDEEDKNEGNKEAAPERGARSEEASDRGKPKKKGRALFLSVPLQEKVLFTRHLSIGIKSGMTLISALELIKEQTKSKSLKIIIAEVIDDISAGMFLSKSLERFNKVFGNLFINIIKIGESSGTLSENLNYLTEELKKKHALKSKVRGALIYPTVVLIATLGIAGAMIIFIFPKILPVFSSLSVELPFTTRALISLSNALTNHGLIISISLVLLVIIFSFLLKLRAVRHIIHHILLYMPVLKRMIIQVNMTNFSRTLGLLLRSGVNISEAISITADTTTNLVYHHELKASAAVLQKGQFLSSYLEKNKKLFPPIASNMIKVGENTGNLVDNLDYLSEYYEGEVDDFVKNLSSIIEPALMIVMGLIVGFIALSIITPIYSLTQGLQQ